MAIITTYTSMKKKVIPTCLDVLSFQFQRMQNIYYILLENAIIETSSFIIDKSLITMDGGTTAGVF